MLAMPKTQPRHQPTAKAPAPILSAPRPFIQTALGRLLLCLATAITFFLSFAPFKQFYLAWLALVPWLLIVAQARSKKAVFFWSWLTGILTFALCMWWIAYVTKPGAMGLMVYMGLYFAFAGLILQSTKLLSLQATASKTTGAIVAIAALWVATEWSWGHLFTGLPWLFLGYSQSPFLAMCQIADVAGVYGVSFWVALINVWLAMFVLAGFRIQRLLVPGALVLALLICTLAYGIFRMQQQTTTPGPVVMVVQPDFPQDNSGAKGASYDDILSFHVKATQDALARQKQKPDLIAWSETMLPELNADYRQAMHGFVRSNGQNFGVFLDSIRQYLSDLAAKYHSNLIVGGHAMLPDRPSLGKPQWSRHNSSYLFDRSGNEARERYDKIHLVPFGEYMPFRESFPLLYQMFNVFNPYKGLDYTVAAGEELTVFHLSAGARSPACRFVTPICFEDVDSELVARMFDGGSGQKRADFMVNLTNDGWFATPQMQQHFQISSFRCIENRVPEARSVNTGISGFVDSVGRHHDLLGAGVSGTATARLDLDRRVAPYTYLRDLFARLCVGATCLLIVLGIWNRMKIRKAGGR